MHSSINPQTYKAAGMVATPLCFFLIFFVDDETSAQFLVAVRLSLARQSLVIVFFQLFSTIKVEIVDEMTYKVLIYVLFYMSSTKILQFIAMPF